MSTDGKYPQNEELCHTPLVHQERVEAARAQAPRSREVERLALTYKILSDPTRLKMVIALAQGEMCVCDLAAYVGSSDSAVSHHLRRLKDMTLVRSRRDGQMLYYTLTDWHVAEILRIGLEHVRE